MSVTLVVPTLNRSDFVIRLLDYYADHDFEGCILLGDSSTPDHVEKIEAAIQRLRGRLKVRHLKAPDTHPNALMEELSTLVDTPYVAFMGDDDLIVPSGLRRCISFLDDHPDYVAAHGKARLFATRSGGAYGDIQPLDEYAIRAIENDTASERLAWHMFRYTVLIFSVVRTSAWQVMYRGVSKVNDKAFGAEIVPVCLCAVLGKVKRVRGLYLLRQVDRPNYKLPGFIDWVGGADWSPAYQFFVERVGAEISRVDGVSKAEGEEAAKRWLHYWMITNVYTWSHKVEEAKRRYIYFVRRQKEAFKARFPLLLAPARIAYRLPSTAWRVLESAAKSGRRGIARFANGARAAKRRLVDATSNDRQKGFQGAAKAARESHADPHPK